MLLTVEVDSLLELSCDEVCPLSHLALSALNGIFNMNMANEIHVTLIYKYSLSPTLYVSTNSCILTMMFYPEHLNNSESP